MALQTISRLGTTQGCPAKEFGTQVRGYLSISDREVRALNRIRSWPIKMGRPPARRTYSPEAYLHTVWVSLFKLGY
jgi:hypothetical protein